MVKNEKRNLLKKKETTVISPSLLGGILKRGFSIRKSINFIYLDFK